MKFLKYINESRSKFISNEEVKNLLHNECSDALKAFYKGKKLFRGYYDNKDYALSIDPKSGKPRKSAYTGSNYYTLLMDNLASWKKYPKRSQSVICSTSYTKAKEYTFSNNVYFVFPYNGSKFGVAPNDDIFTSFKMYDRYQIMGTGRKFNTFLKDFLSISGNNTDKDWNTLLKAFKKYDKLRVYDDNILDFDIMQFDEFTKKEYNGSLLNTFNRLMNPQKNDFRLTKDINTIPAEREVWTDGKCVMILMQEFDDVMKEEEEFADNLTQIFDLEETDESFDYKSNIPCDQILYMYDDMYHAYSVTLPDYIKYHKKLPKSQDAWLLDQSVKIETRNGKYKYFAVGKESGIATIKSCFLGKNTVDVNVIGTGVNPYSTFGDTWEFNKSKKYKNLEDFSDIQGLDYDKENLEDDDLI